jgi:hypothetical protein
MINNNINFNKLSEKIANLLLLKNNSISLSEIRALPFISGNEEVYSIISNLNEKYCLHEESICVKENDLISFDTIYKLVS